MSKVTVEFADVFFIISAEAAGTFLSRCIDIASGILIKSCVSYFKRTALS